MHNTLIWLISGLTIFTVITRPFKLAEYLYALTGAFILLLFGFLNWQEGLNSVLKGIDVYLFLIGMMLLAEAAAITGLFDWLAAHATNLAKGTPHRLFFLIYAVGVIVTVFLSNDATAVVLTPAVATAMRTAKVKNRLPYLFICAFIANAASFVLPISNPANLVIYGPKLPSLLQWLNFYLYPSAIAILITYAVLIFNQRKNLKAFSAAKILVPKLTFGAKAAGGGLIITAITLLMASYLAIPLGLPTLIAGVATALVLILMVKLPAAKIVNGISWSVLPLVAGLFVLVEALSKTGLTNYLTQMLQQNAMHHPDKTLWLSGLFTAFGCNLTNNLPAGLLAGNVIQSAQVPEIIKSSVLIGIDLGPNLSLSGSLATILWLVALRKEGVNVSPIAFLKVGTQVMTITLLMVIASLWLFG